MCLLFDIFSRLSNLESRLLMLYFLVFLLHFSTRAITYVQNGLLQIMYSNGSDIPKTIIAVLVRKQTSRALLWIAIEKNV
jgi:hypothetical protein